MPSRKDYGYGGGAIGTGNGGRGTSGKGNSNSGRIDRIQVEKPWTNKDTVKATVAATGAMGALMGASKWIADNFGGPSTSLGGNKIPTRSNIHDQTHVHPINRKTAHPSPSNTPNTRKKK